MQAAALRSQPDNYSTATKALENAQTTVRVWRQLAGKESGSNWGKTAGFMGTPLACGRGAYPRAEQTGSLAYPAGSRKGLGPQGLPHDEQNPTQKESGAVSQALSRCERGVAGKQHPARQRLFDCRQHQKTDPYDPPRNTYCTKNTFHLTRREEVWKDGAQQIKSLQRPIKAYLGKAPPFRASLAVQASSCSVLLHSNWPSYSKHGQGRNPWIL